jgi:hypothetical protein
MGPYEPINQKQIYFCFICNGPGTSKHHLVPRKVRQERGTQANAIVRTCCKCHRDIHYYISHFELDTKFNTPELLKLELSRRKSIHVGCFTPGMMLTTHEDGLRNRSFKRFKSVKNEMLKLEKRLQTQKLCPDRTQERQRGKQQNANWITGSAAKSERE